MASNRLPVRVAAERRIRLIGYCRVSTSMQAAPDGSLAAQEAAVRRYADTFGHQLVRVAIERQGVSGRIPPDERPTLAAALGDVRAGRADGLIFSYLDRLSRSLQDVLALADEASRGGWHLISTREHLDTTSPMGKFTLTMLAAFAEMQSDMIGETVRGGMAEVARRGWVTSRYTPFGFRFESAAGPWEAQARVRDGDGRRIGPADRRALVECPTELALRDHIVAQLDAGRTPGDVVKQLNHERVPYPRGGDKWKCGSVKAIYRTAVKGRYKADLDA